MPSPEQSTVEHETQKQRPFYKTATFSNEQNAGKAYFEAQETIFKTEDSSLSAFRFQLNQIWHVAVLGEQPSEDLRKTIEAILSSGIPTDIPNEVLKLLTELRAKAVKQGPWFERHYRPGKPL